MCKNIIVKDVFAKRLKELRDEKGYSQAALAKMLDISSGSISYYEAAERTPDIETLYKVSQLFDVDCDYLLGISNIKKDTRESLKVLGLSETGIETIKMITSIMLDNTKYFEDFLKTSVALGLFEQFADYCENYKSYWLNWTPSAYLADHKHWDDDIDAETQELYEHLQEKLGNEFSVEIKKFGIGYLLKEEDDLSDTFLAVVEHNRNSPDVQAKQHEYLCYVKNPRSEWSKEIAKEWAEAEGETNGND